MSKKTIALTALVFGIFLGLSFQNWVATGKDFAETSQPRLEKGGQDVFGPYEVVQDWPKPLSQLPGHDNWTWGAVASVFAESPNRVFLLVHGELPAMKRPAIKPIPEFGPSLSFPIVGVPFRNSSAGPVASLGGEDPGAWLGKVGVDARWEHCLIAVDANGKIVEAWTQWDNLFQKPHAVYVDPYSSEKYVWVVDQGRDAIFKFSHDGKQLLETIGTPNEPGNDEKHFESPTDLAWLPDGTMFVTEKNSRVTKFDKSGKFLMSWGQQSHAANETRPGYFNDLHGIAIDSNRRVYVNDRSNRRVQVFDENGKFLDQWSYGPVSTVTFIATSSDGHLWALDSTTGKLIQYDLQGHYLYSWGSRGDWPGAFWGAHGFSVDREGNLYVAEAANGRAQKFRPRSDANMKLVVGQPIRGN